MLAVGDDALGTGWSFSRCYKCGGYALVRRAEINVIKVDKAPPGEKVILPEASTDPTAGMMNAEATQRAAKYLRPSAPSAQMTPTPNMTPPVPPPFQANHQRATTMDISGITLPEPLPETPENAIKSYVIPIGISTSAILMLISGVYLYMQSQTLWNKTREVSRASANATVNMSNEEHAENQAKAAVPTVYMPRILPNEGGPNANGKTTLSAEALNSDITDRVQKSAMAPLKELPTAKGAQPKCTANPSD